MTEDSGRCGKCHRLKGDHIHPWYYDRFPNACRYHPSQLTYPEQSATWERQAKESDFQIQTARFM